MIYGHCLCGGVQFKVTADLGFVDHCHCSQCRRASGSAFATNAPVPRDALRFTAGEELVREFESSLGKFRSFCSNCGSPIYSRRDAKPDILRMRLGLLDGAPRRGGHAHIWVGSMAPWYKITDDLPQFAEDAPPPRGSG
jgi:hypothetical protein